MRRMGQVLDLLGVVLLVLPLGGCNGGSASTPQPPTNLNLSWVAFDDIFATWTPPSSPVDRYVAEGRIESGSWQVIDDQIPGNATGGAAKLEAATPELVTIGVRMCSVRGGRSSEYTPEATLLRSLRPPSALVVHTLDEDVALTWTQDSTAADAILVERTGGGSGAYQEVATLPASASSWLDSTTGAPGVGYGYRITNLGTYRGAEVRSEPVQRWADNTTRLSPPANLQASVDVRGVHLSWTPTSRNGTAQSVERTEAASVNFTTLAVLDAKASSYLDPAPVAGPYLYRVTVEPRVGGWAATDVLAFVPPPPGPWGLEHEILHVPYADGVALGSDDAWWFARHWTAMGPLAPSDSGIWTPSAVGWDVHRLPGSQGGEYLVEPGLILDPAGEPHALWLLNVDPTPTTSPRRQLRHSWRSGTAWLDELIAERVFSFGHVGCLAQFALDGSGALHVVWQATDGTLNEYASNVSGSWRVTSLPVTLVDVRYVSSLRLSAAPDGTAQVAVRGSILATQQFGMVLLRRLPGGSWSEEVVPTGVLDYHGSMRLLARGTDDVDLLYTQQPSGPGPATYRFQSRTSAGWGSAVTLGEAYSGSGYLLPALAATPEGSRRAALLDLADGLSLATWEAGTGWATTRIQPTVPFDFPWLGFDGLGAVHMLLPGGTPGTDGFAERIHLRSTD